MKRENIVLIGMAVALFFAVFALLLIGYVEIFHSVEVIVEEDSSSVIEEASQFLNHDDIWYWNIQGTMDIRGKTEYTFRANYSKPITSYGIEKFTVKSKSLSELPSKIKDLRALIENDTK